MIGKVLGLVYRAIAAHLIKKAGDYGMVEMYESLDAVSIFGLASSSKVD
jgi:hypothetical protein